MADMEPECLRPNAPHPLKIAPRKLRLWLREEKSLLLTPGCLPRGLLETLWRGQSDTNPCTHSSGQSKHTYHFVYIFIFVYMCEYVIWCRRPLGWFWLGKKLLLFYYGDVEISLYNIRWFRYVERSEGKSVIYKKNRLMVCNSNCVS